MQRMENGKAQGSATKVTATLDINVSAVLRGLKAIQREARKAAQAMRELEAVCETKKLTVKELRVQTLKDTLMNEDKATQDALLLIEEQEQKIAELERTVNEYEVFKKQYEKYQTNLKSLTCPYCGKKDESMYGLPYKTETETARYPHGDE